MLHQFHLKANDEHCGNDSDLTEWLMMFRTSFPRGQQRGQFINMCICYCLLLSHSQF